MLPLVLTAVVGGAASEVAISFFSKTANSSIVNDINKILFWFTLLLSCFYIFGLSFYLFFIDTNLINPLQFFYMSAIFIVSFIFSSLNSYYSSLLLINSGYSDYTKFVIISELVGVMTLLIFINTLDIYSVPLSYMTTSVSLTFLIFYAVKHFISFRDIFQLNLINTIKKSKDFLHDYYKISLQTIVYHIGTIIDRTVSMKYVGEGYLSSYQYSLNVYNMSYGIFNSSLSKTIYIEQSKKANQINDFVSFTISKFKLMILVLFSAQFLLTISSPFLLALFFRRGNFDNNDLLVTSQILSILYTGLSFEIIVLFIIHTLYSLGQYNLTIWLVSLRITLKIFIILTFINYFYHIIPVSTVIPFFIVSIVGVIILKTKYQIQLLNKKLIILATIYFFILYLIHNYIIHHIINFVLSMSNVDLYIYSLFLLVIVISLILFIKRINYRKYLTKIIEFL